MDTAFMRKTFALIAKGLIEKEQFLQKEPTRYPYSKTLQHGVNMFLAASQWAGCQTIAQYADEASFLAHFITKTPSSLLTKKLLKIAITELMKQEGIITPLEQDILNTWAELLKHPLDMSSANEKIVSNNLKYPDIYTKVSVLPSTVQKPVQEITETDLRYILDSQLTFLVQKEQEARSNGQ